MIYDRNEAARAAIVEAANKCIECLEDYHYYGEINSIAASRWAGMRKLAAKFQSVLAFSLAKDISY